MPAVENWEHTILELEIFTVSASHVCFSFHASLIGGCHVLLDTAGPDMRERACSPQPLTQKAIWGVCWLPLKSFCRRPARKMEY